LVLAGPRWQSAAPSRPAS